ncbi:MAG: rhodanese-like domain-containing protein [Ignavibacteria bacterium]|nr:rhodanese-like domain-containing protein [Ignavibacteria bacterium]
MNHKDVSTADFKNYLEEDSYILLDVRTPDEFKSGRLKGASNINFYEETFEDEIDKFDKRKKYLVYCRSGNRSRQAMFLMRDLGFDEVYNLENGIISWDDHGFQIEK